ncbi:hypothetical protein [Streptomyces sp. NPDC001530]|uniref:hypothetical protein n=1 Tax=Streptomyces sp. NPDC001530 TaxID=3364582 RepID=UPI003675113F
MAAEVTGSFEYRIMHIVDRHVNGGGGMTLSTALTNATTGCLERFEDRANQIHETCDHCGARLLVTLPSFADVRRERRVHGVLWKVFALATILSGYGFVHVNRTATGLGYGPGLAFAVTMFATLFFAYRTLLSGLRSTSVGGPHVTRVDSPDRGNVQHRWAWVTADEDS